MANDTHQIVSAMMGGRFEKELFEGFARYSNPLLDVLVIKDMVVVTDKPSNRTTIYKGAKAAAMHKR